MNSDGAVERASERFDAKLQEIYKAGVAAERVKTEAAEAKAEEADDHRDVIRNELHKVEEKLARMELLGETLLSRDPLTDVEEWWDGWESCVYAYQKLIRNTLAGEG